MTSKVSPFLGCAGNPSADSNLMVGATAVIGWVNGASSGVNDYYLGSQQSSGCAGRSAKTALFTNKEACALRARHLGPSSRVLDLTG